eukprot:NODE_3711_length_383_cov_418.829341_g3144_i0.p1 GENE.NODE_3711_length_383_cov_418.829341_g3144_i0~~NODE_3711_length_383_cov_418.829341_g3144_i0.p1  ORF type:complete len:81 (-),score=6.52 NODE_3711_length_383_cov_418.829341_g3144_i0:109-351(-)
MGLDTNAVRSGRHLPAMRETLRQKFRTESFSGLYTSHDVGVYVNSVLQKHTFPSRCFTVSEMMDCERLVYSVFCMSQGTS